MCHSTNSAGRKMCDKCHHNFDVRCCSSLASSLSSRRNIFPDGFFGMLSRYRTPPCNCLKWARFFLTKSLISCSLTFDSSATMYALGSSVSSPCTPMTAASLTCGCVISRASSSAGATWNPLYLINS